MTTTLHHFPNNPGYLLHRCTDQELEILRREVSDIAQARGHGYRPAQGDLVGVIDREFHLRDSRDSIYQLTQGLADRYIMHFGFEQQIHRLGLDVQGLELGALWVNFQQPGEYNPVHWHDGLFSFVIWLEVPYLLEQERSQGPGHRSDKPNGDFHFHYTNSLGQIMTHPMDIDRNSQGTLCLFPAEMHHVVYPYYSTDSTRITVSGNLHLRAASRVEP